MSFPVHAYTTLMERVYAPVFFSKLAADYGIHPHNSEDRLRLLEMATLIRGADVFNKLAAAQGVHNSNHYKEDSRLYKKAADDLKLALRRAGFVAGPTESEQVVQQVVHSLAQDPVVRASVGEYVNFFTNQ